MSIGSERQVGPYKLLSPISAGAMGEVEKAKDTRLERTLAIKVLPERFSRLVPSER
ncbi:MAG: hypothetical protein BMS9Abin37_0955 [Acidobacteriota bacterium]|nr:MAG: hypothetical protein BMS9Abin37_0955 [Acidobacteriota bacterium]